MSKDNAIRGVKLGTGVSLGCLCSVALPLLREPVDFVEVMLDGIFELREEICIGPLIGSSQWQHAIQILLQGSVIGVMMMAMM